MLRRERQVLSQVQKYVDAALVAFSFWWAHWLRAHGAFDFVFQRPEIQEFGTYAWLLLVILPITPLFLQLQGFYARPLGTLR